MKANDDQPLMEDVMIKPPRKMITHGSIILIACVVLLLLSGFVIKIPDTIPARIEIFNQVPWVEIKSDRDGRILNIMVQEGAFVTKDQALVVLDNSIDYAKYHKLRDLINESKKLTRQQQNTFELEKYSVGPDDYGNFQDLYLNLYNKIDEYFKLVKSDEYADKINSYETILKDHYQINKELFSRQALFNEELELHKKHFTRFDTLHKNEIISEAEYENVTALFIEKKQVLLELKTLISGNKQKMNYIQKEIRFLEWELKNRKQNLLKEISKEIAHLSKALNTWDQNYVLRSPIAGIVNYANYWTESQFLPKGVSVLTVIPDSEARIVGKLKCDAKGFGKVNIQQKVKISLKNFPASDFGYLWGVIRQKPDIPIDGEYVVDVSFPRAFKTTKNSSIDFSQYAEGIGEIIVGEETLVEHLLAEVGFNLSKFF